MQDFPENRKPNSISYDIGGINVSESNTLSSGPIRFRHSNVVTNHQITLRYKDLTQSEATLFRQHYLDAAGVHNQFKIPLKIFGGAGITNENSVYRYSTTPEEIQKGVYHDMDIQVFCLTGVDLDHQLQSGGSTTATAKIINESFFATGTSPFYLFCDDAVPHQGHTLEYVLIGGNAKGL